MAGRLVRRRATVVSVGHASAHSGRNSNGSIRPGAPWPTRAGARFERLVEIMRALRAPGGCPWDREQTLASLRPFVLEETYEVLEAIERGDAGGPARGARRLPLRGGVPGADQRGGRATSPSPTPSTAICDKLVRRHPHVFARAAGDAGADQRPGARAVGDDQGARARRGRRRPAQAPKTTLSGVPKTLPALLRAYEISTRAAAVGFDWAAPATCSTRSTRRSPSCGTRSSRAPPATCRAPRRRWATCCSRSPTSSRKLGIEPEAALRRANDKFTPRFDAVERAFAARGRRSSDATLDEMESGVAAGEGSHYGRTRRRTRECRDRHRAVVSCHDDLTVAVGAVDLRAGGVQPGEHLWRGMTERLPRPQLISAICGRHASSNAP